MTNEQILELAEKFKFCLLDEDDGFESVETPEGLDWIIP